MVVLSPAEPQTAIEDLRFLAQDAISVTRGNGTEGTVFSTVLRSAGFGTTTRGAVSLDDESARCRRNCNLISIWYREERRWTDLPFSEKKRLASYDQSCPFEGVIGTGAMGDGPEPVASTFRDWIAAVVAKNAYIDPGSPSEYRILQILQWPHER